MNFEHLSLEPRILAGVQEAGYTTPTPIQQQAIPLVLQNRDVLGLAQTGTGKTAAFMLPILNRLLTGRLGQVRALIIAPTRELAEQIHQTAVTLGKKTRIRSVAIYGGVSKERQVWALRRGAEIVVACPGRLLDHLGDGSIDLSHVEVLVLDEADRMMDMGFLPDIRRILKQVPAQRQTLFFSATMPDEIRTLANEILVDPATVQVGMIAPVETVSHALYPITEGLKSRLLFALLPQIETQRVLVFTRTKRRARNLARDLEAQGYNVAALQGNMAQNRRLEAINGFRNGAYDILVATDIAARGIDVSEISHVINFDMPDTVDAYTHRIGRTGRAERSGEAFTFMLPADESIVRDIERLLSTRIDRRQLPGFDYAGFVPNVQPASNPAGRDSGQARRAQVQSGHHREHGGNGQQVSRENGARRPAQPVSQPRAGGATPAPRRRSRRPRYSPPAG